MAFSLLFFSLSFASMYCLDRFCKALFFYYIIKLFLSLTGLDAVFSNFVDDLKGEAIVN
jgi:hypothetical protein